MNEWTVVVVIIALVGLIFTVITPVIRNNTVITRLTVTVESLVKAIEKNNDCHDTFTDQLADHETRIQIMEKTNK